MQVARDRKSLASLPSSRDDGDADYENDGIDGDDDGDGAGDGDGDEDGDGNGDSVAYCDYDDAYGSGGAAYWP